MIIDFYILETTSPQQSSIFACELLEKLVTEQKVPIFVQTNNREEAERFDDLLWTFREDSFLPHELHAVNPSSPIQIGEGENPQTPYAVLLNISSNLPAFYAQCAHVIEIVFNDPVMQQLARLRYKQYRDNGHDINTIKLKAN
jgi:DNA polymerase-3 subunit chi